MANEYEVDTNDRRFTEVDSERENELNQNDIEYNDMINSSDEFYQNQINASKDWADKQTELQNEKTDFAIEKIEQQKEQTKSDYLKEQSGAYTDWQKQSNQYGANAEQRASMGMANTGYSESSQVSMYNTYQNRVATAREAFNRAVLNYDNAIKDAQLQNNSILAEIAYEAQKEQLSLALQGFQYKNTLVSQKAAARREINRHYDTLWQNVYSNILEEIRINETARQHDEQMAEERRQFNASHALEKSKFAWQKEQASKSSSSGGGGSIKKGSSSGGTSKTIKPTSIKNPSEKLEGGEEEILVSAEPEIDMDSLKKALGDIGQPATLSAESIDKLVQSGALIETEEDGKIKFSASEAEKRRVRYSPKRTATGEVPKASSKTLADQIDPKVDEFMTRYKNKKTIWDLV